MAEAIQHVCGRASAWLSPWMALAMPLTKVIARAMALAMALALAMAVALALAIWKVEKSENFQNFKSSQNGLAYSGKS